MLNREQIIDRIPVHKNIHKSDIVAYSYRDDNRTYAEILYFPLGYYQFMSDKLRKQEINSDDIQMGFIAQLLETKYGKPFDLDDDYTNWAECTLAFSYFLEEYQLTDVEKKCVDELASKYAFTLDVAWFFLEAMKYRPNSKIEISTVDREIIDLYYKDDDLDGFNNLLNWYLGLEPIK